MIFHVIVPTTSVNYQQQLLNRIARKYSIEYLLHFQKNWIWIFLNSVNLWQSADELPDTFKHHEKILWSALFKLWINVCICTKSSEKQFSLWKQAKEIENGAAIKNKENPRKMYELLRNRREVENHTPDAALVIQIVNQIMCRSVI